MKKLKIAVIGVGFLGKFHAEKYQQCHSAELIAVCDKNIAQCNAIAQSLKVTPIYDDQQLLGQVDAVSIATPTTTHHNIAKRFLEAGIHVLLEKPITQTITQAEDLIKTALQNHALLQIGHLEQYNPAVLQLKQWVDNPKLIESVRTGPFQPRNLDVSVILDLMIHDIDIIQTLHPYPIQTIDATGFFMMSDSYDAANVKLTFEDGCIAHLTASRITHAKERSLKIYQENMAIFADYQTQGVTCYQKEGSSLNLTEFPVGQREDTLAAQIHAFIEAIYTQKTPRVSGNQGKKVLETALAIELAIKKHEKEAITT